MERDEEDEEWGFIEDDEDRNGTRGTMLFARGVLIGTGSLSFARAQRLTATAWCHGRGRAIIHSY
jgi:hypothetical protein